MTAKRPASRSDSARSSQKPPKKKPQALAPKRPRQTEPGVGRKAQAPRRQWLERGGQAPQRQEAVTLRPALAAPLRGESRARDHFIVDSLSALNEFVKFRPEAIKGIYCQPRLYRKLLASYPQQSSLIFQLEESPEAADANRPVKPFWAEVRLEPLAEAEFAKKRQTRQKDLLVLLDHITDPRNLGAIARSAAFFGVSELIIAKDRQVGLTDSAVATAQGAFALTELVEVTNLVRTLTTLKEEGYWIIGCTVQGEALEKLAGRYEKVVLVLGSEDKGLSPLIEKNCDVFVGIAGASQRLDSLNVSVAAGILLRGFSLA